MNIVFVTYHTCARAAKLAKALTTPGHIFPGHQVIILQHLAASEEILYEQQTCAFYRDETDLPAKVAMLSDWADIFHVHNEPDWMVSVTKAHTGKPVIYDCHDLDSQRKGQASIDECLAFAAADAALFPSVSYAAGAIGYHDLKIPTGVYYSMCTRADIESSGQDGIYLPRIPALAYEGHHIAPLGGDRFAPGHPLYYEYRDYLRFVSECAVKAVPTAFYGTKPEFREEYRRRGALVFPMLPFNVLLAELTRYKWGFCGHPTRHPQWDKAMPNKLFEYLAAGIPVIAWNCAEVEEYVVENGFGVSVESYRQLAEVFEDWQLRARCAGKVQTSVDLFAMECQVPDIEQFYGKVRGAKADAS